jgi:peptidoglycan hydrolase CwlO-like protein
MEKLIITEAQVKDVLSRILNEESSKVRREEFNRVQFKIDELQNSLNDTLKELRKLDDCVPSGLKSVCNSRVNGISSNLNSAQKILTQLKEKIKSHKKSLYSQSIEEKKK